ncbi:polyketide cyclase/dehydrase/lipid transport protein [Paracoccus pantotrophus]|uniref:Polyketide cyclase/dehydrase/lipid transport protein n=1 Tax=Paracoccus pantotrophus TaxID=82367 RepID=A0AAE6NZQ0_PARPN|nr:SRPBCC family protein [Paracoccus pantotrophus]QFG38523.1 SRPBCC family protein [Paracoccus pantotrophus]RKS50945.1 polyketide cyclase/dehydrase/lipid transport protein [Paracoccus pantotrophus]
MIRLLALTVGATMAMAPAAEAHGPPRLKLEMQQKLDATPDEVWAAIGRFDDMSWHPAIASLELAGDGSADQPETSTRVLHLKADAGDPTITEVLSRWQPEKRCYAYRIEAVEVTVLPVTNYAATLCVTDEGGKALVNWKGGFYRGYPNNEPPPELNDEAAIQAITGVYQAGLDALAERFGKAE